MQAPIIIVIFFNKSVITCACLPGIKTIKFYMKFPSDLYITYWIAIEIQRNTSAAIEACMMQSLIFGLTSAYYSLQKWDHLQMNRLFMGSKNMNSLLWYLLRILKIAAFQFKAVISLSLKITCNQTNAHNFRIL